MPDPTSAGYCQVCGRHAQKRYGGMGRYLVMCIDCWVASEPPSRGDQSTKPERKGSVSEPTTSEPMTESERKGSVNDTDTTLLSMTMSPDAAMSLWRALVWAMGKAEETPGREDTREWLMWAQARVGHMLLVHDEGIFG